MTIGAETVGRTRSTSASAARRLPPAASARSVARWMTGPSASGSENGTPTSSTSAPARSSAFRISADRGRSGSPAVVNVTRPGCRRASREVRVEALTRSPPDAARCFSTVCTSLSPRPDRFTRMIAVAPELARRASARTRWRAPTRAPAGCPRGAPASETPRAPRRRVTWTYSARPCARSHACSGPTAA